MNNIIKEIFKHFKPINEEVYLDREIDSTEIYFYCMGGNSDQSRFRIDIQKCDNDNDNYIMSTCLLDSMGGIALLQEEKNVDEIIILLDLEIIGRDNCRCLLFREPKRRHMIMKTPN